MSAIIAMCLFSLSMSISPGPVNVITLALGLNHGFRHTLSFVTGASVGFSSLLLAVGLGLGSLTYRYPYILHVLGFAGAGLMGYMGYKIATSSSVLVKQSHDFRPSFFKGFALQWINPKAWVACLSGVSAFSLAHSRPMLLTFVGLYFAICYLSIACWALIGEKMIRVINSPSSVHGVNRCLGILLIGVAIYLLVLQIESLLDFLNVEVLRGEVGVKN